MKNQETNFVRLIREICKEEQISLRFFSDYWVMELKREEKTSHIFGYQFGLNPSVGQMICNDKSCAYEILTAKQIPAVAHLCFMTPAQMKYVGQNGCFVELTSLLEQWGTIVIKDNEGTGGMEVYRASSRVELENICVNLLPKVRSIAASPYIDIARECRIVMLDGKAKIAFSKERQSVIGDGVHTVSELLLKEIQNGRMNLAGLELTAKKAAMVPTVGEQVVLNWKHNLGQGAKALILSDEEMRTYEPIARAATEALGVRFASVDIITEANTNKQMVLEVNSGVMMENLANTSEEVYQRVKLIYKEAILKMLAE